MRSRRRWLILVSIGAVVGLAAWWFRSEESEAPTVVEEVEDTGMTPEQTEELMRAIGYVQQ